MSGDDILDEDLAALADGELAAAKAAGLRARIAEDPELAERFALFVETRALLEPAGEDALKESEQPGLAALAAAIRGAEGAPSEVSRRPSLTVVDGGGARPAPTVPAARRAPPFRVAALAASIALVFGGALGFYAGRSVEGGQTPGNVVAFASSAGAAAAVSSALERSPSAEKVGWNDPASRRKGEISVIATHRLKDGGVCREYELSVEGMDGAALGLGCRDGGGWRTEVLARGAASGSSYGTASGANILESALEAMGGEGALPAEDEKALLGVGWKDGGR